MNGSTLALQWGDLGLGMLVAVGLMILFWLPYLIKEIRDGKRDSGPLRRLSGSGGVTLGTRTPDGTGDINPGRHGDPAPGQPDGRGDPYGPRAQRNAPPVQS
jgi:hypothetical protein